MAVLLTILKVTGIVILALLALVILAVLIILFVPVRYRITADKNENGEDLYAKIKVTFLLHMISAGFVYDGETDLFVKLFGIRVYPKNNKEDDVPEEPNEPGNEEEQAILSNESVHDDIEAQYTIDWNDEPEDEYLAEVFGISDEEPANDEEPDDEDLWDRFEKLIEKVCDKFSSITEKYENFKKKTEYLRREINDRRNRRAAGHIKNVVISVLKKIAPRKVRGYVHFGSDDPSVTGGVLAFLGIIYPILPRRFIIEPDFENAVLYGKIDIKGHIALIVPAVALLKLYLDKDCRRMWYRYRKHKAEDTN